MYGENGCECQRTIDDWCRVKHEGTGLVCSLAKKHDGDHKACNSTRHPLVIWDNEDKPAPGRGYRLGGI